MHKRNKAGGDMCSLKKKKERGGEGGGVKIMRTPNPIGCTHMELSALKVPNPRGGPGMDHQSAVLLGAMQPKGTSSFWRGGKGGG